jgi:hypothetical protein
VNSKEENSKTFVPITSKNLASLHLTARSNLEILNWNMFCENVEKYAIC